MSQSLYIFLIFFVAGVIQGVLEWLPVSSEAFVSIFLILCGIDPYIAILLAIVYHLPTGLASILFYREEYFLALREIIHLSLSPKSRYLVVTTVFTVVSAVPLFFLLEKMLVTMEKQVEHVAITVFLIIGLLMIITGILVGGRRPIGVRKLEDATHHDYMFVGVVQGFSILPGVSRSGVTIAALLYRKFDGESSLNGSFMLSGIASIGVFVFLLAIGRVGLDIMMSPIIIISMLATFFISMVVMRILLDFARKISYNKFLVFMGSIMVLLGSLSYLIAY